MNVNFNRVMLWCRRFWRLFFTIWFLLRVLIYNFFTIIYKNKYIEKLRFHGFDRFQIYHFEYKPSSGVFETQNLISMLFLLIKLQTILLLKYGQSIWKKCKEIGTSRTKDYTMELFFTSTAPLLFIYFCFIICVLI